MHSATRYSAYDSCARIVNEYWGPEGIKFRFPIVDQLLLKHLPEKAQILDLCCGAGHLAESILKKGYQVTGLDASVDMLSYARKNAPGGKFILDDARFFKLSSTFHGVISTDYSLNHVINLEDLTCVFKNVYVALLSNGLFMFDLRLDEQYQGSWNNSMNGDIKDDYAWAARRNYNPEERIGKVYITIFQLIDKNWQRLDKTWLVKGYNCAEVQTALKDVGFSEVSVFSAEHDFAQKGEPGTVYFICRK